MTERLPLFNTLETTATEQRKEKNGKKNTELR